MLLLILGAVLSYLAYKWSTSTYDFFRKQGIPFRKPYPLVGTSGSLFYDRESFITLVQDWYYEFKDEKLSGLFEFRRPIVFLKDPKLIKLLAVKDFDYFTDHRSLISEDTDPMFGKTLIALQGQKWKDMRGTLSPAFTGSKMRQMMDFVSQVGFQTVETMRKDIENGAESSLELNALASKFTVDIIASTAFGIEINSFKNPNNDFLRIAKKVTNFTDWKTGLKFAGNLVFPQLMKALKIRLLDAESCDFFENAIYETFKTREELGIVRHDMINLMLEARRGNLSHNKNAEEKIVDGFATVEESQMGKSQVKHDWTDADFAAQCFIFFLGGFDSVAQAMSFAGYELACNPDVQQKLYDEILEMNNEVDGKKINYDQLQSMKYLDQVISETLRMWPPAPATDRTCVKDYTLKYDNKTLNFTPGMSFFIPIYALHHDPKYFPNPGKFDPERFSDENKSSIDPDTYMPFSLGPRNCIGSRFALMEVKTILYYLLLNFSFEVTEKTQIPLQLEKTPFVIRAEKGIWVQLKPRAVA